MDEESLMIGAIVAGLVFVALTMFGLIRSLLRDWP
jgi:hypothetical protein